jgi:hypothetical protein
MNQHRRVTKLSESLREDMKEHLQSDRRGVGRRARLRGPWSHSYRSRARREIVSINALEAPLPLSLPIVALESDVLLTTVVGLPVRLLPLPLFDLPSHAGTGPGAIAAPLVARATEDDLDAAATARLGPKFHASSAAGATELDIASGP